MDHLLQTLLTMLHIKILKQQDSIPLTPGTEQSLEELRSHLQVLIFQQIQQLTISPLTALIALSVLLILHQSHVLLDLDLD
jgi:hypothetical protein